MVPEKLVQRGVFVDPYDLIDRYDRIAVDGSFNEKMFLSLIHIFWMDENQENIKQRLEHVIRKIEEIPERLKIPNLFPVFGIFHTIVLDEIDPLYGNAVQALSLIHI